MFSGDGPGFLQDLLPMMAKVMGAVVLAQRTHHHCDLDPRRILLQEDGSVRIFPLEDTEGDKTLLLSSFKYSSPELLQGDTSVDSALSHSYALGFVFYELLLGRKRFEEQFSQVRQGANGGWLIWHVDRKMRAVPLRQLRPDVPTFVSEAIEKMMAKNPAERSNDLEGTARLFDRNSQLTSTYMLLRASGIGPKKSSSAEALPSGPRPWLIWLGERPWWRALWRRVTPEDPRPGQASIQELEQMLRQVENTLLPRLRSRTNSSAQKRTRRQNPGKSPA
jgi:serine/threonine protein kinase